MKDAEQQKQNSSFAYTKKSNGNNHSKHKQTNKLLIIPI